MKTSLPYKFIIMCMLLIALGFFIISSIIFSMKEDETIEERSSSLYKIAYNLANSFDRDTLSTTAPTYKTIANAIDAQLIIIEPDGNILFDSNKPLDEPSTKKLDLFNPEFFGKSYWKKGNFFGYLPNDMVTVIASVTEDYVVTSYITIHQSLSNMTQEAFTGFSLNYYSFGIMAIMLILFLVFVISTTCRPLKRLVEGINHYAKSDFDYVITKLPNDEIGRLGESLNYMAGKLGEAEQVQKKFVSNVSHDFRSPLTSIKGYLEAIADGTIPPDQTQKYINIVLFETDRLTKLTNNLLTLNDLDSTTIHVDISDFDIIPMIKHTVETFEGTCKPKNITFQLIFSSKNVEVTADYSKIQQVVYNLVDNAIKFSPQDSQIYIIVTEKNDKAFISVKDSGCGIPRQNINKIWDRFYKTDASRGKDKKSSGLGLSIVREIILAHNEKIDVVSTEGVGTEFTFSLPKVK